MNRTLRTTRKSVRLTSILRVKPPHNTLIGKPRSCCLFTQTAHTDRDSLKCETQRQMIMQHWWRSPFCFSQVVNTPRQILWLKGVFVTSFIMIKKTYLQLMMFLDVLTYGTTKQLNGNTKLTRKVATSESEQIFLTMISINRKNRALLPHSGFGFSFSLSES